MATGLGATRLDFLPPPRNLINVRVQWVVWFTDRDKRVKDKNTKFFGLIISFLQYFCDNLGVRFNMLPYFIHNIGRSYLRMLETWSFEVRQY